VLRVTDLSAGYNGFAAVRDINLEVAAGELVLLAGANGSGRTTVLSAIAGTVTRLSGEVRIGDGLVSSRPEAAARMGLAYVTSGRGLFDGLTVAENLRLAARKTGVALPPGFEMIGPLLSRRAGLLSGGEARLVSLAMALVGKPRVLMVDELSLGLAAAAVIPALTTLRNLVDQADLAVLLVEQHVQLACDYADRSYTMDRGRIAHGSTGELFRDS